MCPICLHLIAAVRWLCVERSLMRALCAGHSFSAPATRCTLVDFFNTCALYALCMRTAYVHRASNTLCMRCQLASFFQILTKVQRTTTHWSYLSFFYARTVRRVGVTGPLKRHRHYGCLELTLLYLNYYPTWEGGVLRFGLLQIKGNE